MTLGSELRALSIAVSRRQVGKHWLVLVVAENSIVYLRL
jgi:hypothetical protein